MTDLKPRSHAGSGDGGGPITPDQSTHAFAGTGVATS